MPTKPRQIRRKDRQMAEGEHLDLLARGEYGYLSTVSAEGQPYGVPISYVFLDGAIYLHCARLGHKLDNLAANDRVSFCVVGKTRVLPDQFATEYESVVLFGSAAVIDGAERETALLGLLHKYSPGHLQAGREYIQQKNLATLVLKITIEQVSGKARR